MTANAALESKGDFPLACTSRAVPPGVTSAYQLPTR